MTAALDFSLDGLDDHLADDFAEPVAIIGMAGRFPMAETMEEYWDNLVEGRDCHQPFPPSRGHGMVFGDAELCEAGYLSDIAGFDHSFFDISRREASLMDPNQRIFLEEAHHALEDAGLVNSIRGTHAGVWIGFSKDQAVDFARHVQTRHPELSGDLSVAGNMGSVIASRIAYFLDLRGPAVSLDTACSSGLYAMLSAVRALQRGEVPVALAGSVKVNIEPIQRGLDDEIGIRSADHRAKTFDRRADGISSGEGACTLVLKRLSDAQADGDRIRAVIKGIAANQDGKTVGITAPNPDAQTELLLSCWESSGADLQNLVHIEAHGTGTPLGDPIEVSAIATALDNLESGPTSVGLGSVKPNIGHLDHLAPLASVAKSVLMLEHGALVPTISLEEPNPKLELVDSPLYVNDVLRPLPGTSGRALTAVSAFGLAGTNVHVLLEAAPAPEHVEVTDEGVEHAVVLSARTESALRQRVVDLVTWLETYPSIRLPEVAVAARAQSGDHGHRLACVATTRHELLESLGSWLTGGEHALVLVGAPHGHARSLTASSGAAAEATAFVGGVLLPVAHQPRTVSLPGYPFAPVTCWPNDLLPARSIPTPTTVLHTEVESIYRLQLASRTCWALLEHKVGAQHVLPGTALIDVIVRLMRERGIAGPLELSDIFFLRPLALGIDDRAELWIVLRRRAQHEEFEIVHAAEGETQTLVTGRVSGITENAEVITVPPRSDLRELPDDQQRRIEVGIGRHWTDIRRWIGQLNDDTFFARFDVPATDRAQAQESECYPPLLDRAFNALNAHVGDGTYLPFSIARLVINRAADLSSVARLTQHDAEPEGMTFDVALMNRQGDVAMHASEYRVRQIDDTSRPQDATRHEPYWARLEPITGAVQPTSLALLGSGDATAPYADVARGLGITSIIVDADPAEIAERLEPGAILIDVGHSAASTASSVGDVDNEITRCADIAMAMPTMAAKDIRVVVVDGKRSEAGLMWALSKSVNEEFAGQRFRMIVREDATPDEVLREALAAERPDQVRLFSGAPHEERFRPVSRTVAGTSERIAGQHHLITGGSGELAASLTGWLAGRGAGSVSLMGRRAADELPQLGDLRDGKRAAGAEVSYFTCDIADETSLASAIAQATAAHGPVHYVWHLAGLADESLLVNIRHHEFCDVLAPKVRGTWLLDQLTKEQPLEAFVAFSSISSLAGGIGQAGYATANGYLDRFVEQREGPGLSVGLNWAAWSEQGLGVRFALDDSQNTLFALSNEEAFDLLDDVLARPRRRSVLGRPNAHVINNRQGSPLFFGGSSSRHPTGPGQSESSARAASDIRADAADAPTEDLVLAAWQATLGDQPLDVQETFTNAGGDSILAVRLMRELRSRFGDVVDISSVFTYPTIESMSGHLEKVLMPLEPTPLDTPVSGSETDDELEDLLNNLANGDVTVAQASARSREMEKA